MIRVILESPLAALTREGIEANKRYARKCMMDCLKRGESPFASHLLFEAPGEILDEQVGLQRKMGMAAGFAWGDVSQKTVVYTDLGISPGMVEGIARATAAKRPIEYRSIPWEVPVTDVH